MIVQGRRSSTPVSTENSQQTSPKEKRRFTFGFLDRKPAGSATATPGSSSEAVSLPAPSSTGTTPKTSTPNPTASLPAGSTTPTKSSLRSRMIEKFMGKSPGGTALSSPITIDKSGNFTDNQHSGSSSPPKRKFTIYAHIQHLDTNIYCDKNRSTRLKFVQLKK
jgi:hypothetical protein